ncbi:gluconeogenesis factor YvcK family protein [Halanaerobaculum tunisiense]
MKKLKWLYPGMRFKRWLLLVGLGILLVSVGVAILIGFEALSVIENVLIEFVYLLTGEFTLVINKVLGVIIIISGLYCVAVGIKRMINSVYEVVLPEQNTELVDLFLQKRYLNKGPKIVVVGGGTGLSTLLRGLKKYTTNVTALVTVADDGGSSGMLRDELGVLPPGDIRNCLVALADTEPLMEKLFQYRYTKGTDLKGHSFGNLFIATMSEVLGDFEKGVKASSEVLAIRGQVLPATLEDVTLSARLQDGQIVKGESQIPEADGAIEEVFIDPVDSDPVPEALAAIEDADAIILGPGSLYTSVLPNLLVENLNQAIKDSEAMTAYVCNVMTQPGETDGYTASDHVQAIYDHIDSEIMDYILVNDQQIEPELLEKYAEEGSEPVEIDLAKLKEQGVKVIQEQMINQSDLVRHDSDDLAKAIMDLVIKNLE